MRYKCGASGSRVRAVGRAVLWRSGLRTESRTPAGLGSCGAGHLGRWGTHGWWGASEWWGTSGGGCGGAGWRCEGIVGGAMVAREGRVAPGRSRAALATLFVGEPARVRRSTYGAWPAPQQGGVAGQRSAYGRGPTPRSCWPSGDREVGSPVHCLTARARRRADWRAGPAVAQARRAHACSRRLLAEGRGRLAVGLRRRLNRRRGRGGMPRGALGPGGGAFGVSIAGWLAPGPPVVVRRRRPIRRR